ALALLGERVLPEPGVVALGVGLVGLHPRLGHLGPGLLGVTLPLRLKLALALLDLGGLHGLHPGLLELVPRLPAPPLRARLVLRREGGLGVLLAIEGEGFLFRRQTLGAGLLALAAGIGGLGPQLLGCLEVALACLQPLLLFLRLGRLLPGLGLRRLVRVLGVF